MVEGVNREKKYFSDVPFRWFQACARYTKDGKVYSWGCNLHGQLGLGDHKDRAAPSLVSYLSEERVAAGGDRPIQSTHWFLRSFIHL